MNLIKTLILYSIWITLLFQACSQTQKPTEYTLIVNLENAPFDSLYLHDYTGEKSYVVTGKKTDRFTWEFSIPDSVVDNFLFMELVINKYDPITNSSRTVRFLTEENGKQTSIANVGVQDRLSYIYGTYLKETLFPDEGITDFDGSRHEGDLVIEDFELIIKDENSDMAVRSKEPFFSWFMSNDKTYDELLPSYVDLAKQHPDSRFLMTYLSDNLKAYRSKEDAKKVYDALSDKHKNTHWAEYIERYLNTDHFENTSLARIDNDTEEDIVQDASKHNLIIFSASWCLPCIEEIPLLKKINDDLGDNLIFTYVSMDEERHVPSFQRILEQHDIPWRSLYAYKDLKGIEKKYFAQVLPHNILVYPDGKIEIIDVRTEKHREKLFSLFKG